MRRIILVLMFVVCLFETFATDYFVGGPGASDNNSGTSSQPFATIQKAASVAKAGDVVTIRAGVYRETIVPANSGNGGAPIIFQAEPGAKAVISGLNRADGGWTVHNGNIYKKSITLPVNGYNLNTTNNTTLLANQVFKDGVMMFEARWPKLNNVEDLMDRNKNRLRSSSIIISGTSTTDSEIPNIPGGWVGGTIWIQGWYVTNTRTITSHSSGRVGYANVGSSDKYRRYYYLTGKLAALTQAKEWHYESGTLYFWQPGGGSPTGVEYKARNYGFDLTNRSYITIKGLEFVGCTPMHGNTSSTNVTIDGIKAKYMNHAVLQQDPDLIYHNAKQTGIKLIGENSVIKNSELQWAASQAIWLGERCVAENNLITDISYEGNYGAGVTLWERTGNQIIRNNTFARTGRSAIDFGYVSFGQHLNVRIEYNDIYHFGMLNVDLGGIYGARMTNLTGTRIHHNWIHDSKATNDAENLQLGINTGIYFDQAAGPATCDHNVLWSNVQTDVYTQPNYGGRNSGVSYYYNNTFTTNAGNGGNRHSYKSSVPSPIDVQRNNIYRDDIIVDLNRVTANVANSLLSGTNPQFVGSGNGGLAYRLSSGSPGINGGIVIAGITDGSVGAPDIGAYEFGGTEWVAGYKAVNPPTAPPINIPPVVNISAPANNASFKVGVPINITANASDANGTVTKVEFFRGTTKLGEDFTSPYSFSWTNATAGVHTLTVKATDNENSVVTSSPITITITADAPTVAITSPSNNSTFTAGSTVTIAAAASATGGSISKVEFFSGTTKIGEDLTSPYSFAWTNVPAGTITLTAKVIDNANNVTTSSPLIIVINTNTSPVVTLTSPPNNATYIVGDAITITASASDSDGTIAKVEFYNGTTKLGEDVTSPYSFVWNNATAGTKILTAKATDNQNSVTTSASRNVIVNVNAAPSVAITGPSNNATVTAGTPITINAVAADSDGSVKKVEFFHGTTKLGEDLTSPYSFVWNDVTAGTKVLTAKATDNRNKTTMSSSVNVIVETNNPPSVALTSPASNTKFSAGVAITINASASDADGAVTKVEFYNGTTKLGEDLTSPYSFVWNNVTEGSKVLTAKATDNKNNVTTSESVIINIGLNTPPIVSITGPLNNTKFLPGASILIEAAASDPDGTLTKVEFFNGATKIGEDLISPYSLMWTDAPIGTNVLTAKAFDNENGVTISASVAVLVQLNSLPEVKITSPVNNGEFVAGNAITIDVSAADEDGAVTKVEFFNGAEKLGEDLTAPYSLTWHDASEGNYVLTATATDNENAEGTSQPVNIFVTNSGAPVVTEGESLQNAIPRFFSPNDDGMGDYWEWSQSELFENSLLTVFNRSGQKIYEAVSYKNTWDGKSNGKPLQPGDYYYVIKMDDLTDIKGSVRIIR